MAVSSLGGGDPPADESRSGLARSAAACASQSGEAGAADESCSGLARSAAARASQSGEAESLIGIDLKRFGIMMMTTFRDKTGRNESRN